MAHSQGPLTDEHLKQKVKDNLKRKVDIFVNRRKADKEKVFIFTNRAEMWRAGLGPKPKKREICVRTDEPKVPISKKYMKMKKKTYDVMREMNWYICKYTNTLKAEIDWSLYNSGTDDKPEVHVVFARNQLEAPWQFLKVQPINPCPTNKLIGKGHSDLSPISEESSVLSTSSASHCPCPGPSHRHSPPPGGYSPTAPEDMV